jgi:predicted transcriptional regulator
MKSISLKLQDQILEETEKLLEHLKTSRNKYINEAIEFYNQYQKRRLIEEQLIKESKIVASDSMEVLEEFESLEDEL